MDTPLLLAVQVINVLVTLGAFGYVIRMEHRMTRIETIIERRREMRRPDEPHA